MSDTHLKSESLHQAQNNDYMQHIVDPSTPHPDHHDDTRTISGHDDDHTHKKDKEGAKGTESDEWVTDLRNPRNWSPAKKWLMTCIVSRSIFYS